MPAGGTKTQAQTAGRQVKAEVVTVGETAKNHQPNKAGQIMATKPRSKKLKPVIVRTYSAGVHFGYLKSKKGKEVELLKSRRIFRWYGANSCSGLASKGLDVSRSTVADPVSITLTEAIEIIECTPEAVKSIESATWTNK